MMRKVSMNQDKLVKIFHEQETLTFWENLF